MALLDKYQAQVQNVIYSVWGMNMGTSPHDHHTVYNVHQHKYRINMSMSNSAVSISHRTL